MTRRSYRQNCALAQGCDLLGERWTLLLLRELVIQPCQFGQLNDYLRGMGTNLLARRLRELEALDLIAKTDPASKRSAYALTADGLDVEPVLLELIRWGYRFGIRDDESIHCDHWDLLAMRAFFDPARCRAESCVQFDSASLTAWVRVSSRGIEHGMGRAEDPDIEIRSSIAEFQTDIADGRYRGRSDIQAFVACFELPRRRQPALNAALTAQAAAMSAM